MTRDTVIATLFTAFRRELDEAALVLYQRGCSDLSPALLEAAVLRAIRTRRFLPTVAELRDDAETCRAERSVAMPWHPCEACREHYPPGWVSARDTAGNLRLARCACWQAHQVALAGAGVTGRPVVVAALPEAAEVDA